MQKLKSLKQFQSEINDAIHPEQLIYIQGGREGGSAETKGGSMIDNNGVAHDTVWRRDGEIYNVTYQLADFQ